MEFALAALAVTLLVLTLREHGARAKSTAALAAARAEAAQARRLLHLATGELRAIAIGLSALAVAEADPGRQIQVQGRRLLTLAEDLAEHSTPPAAAPRLSEEMIALGPLLELARGQIADQLGRGKRLWRVAPALGRVTLRADRRALHQVLIRVLASAVMATREGDWIDISAVADTEVWRLVIADEGRGLAQDRVAPKGPETRGLGFGLSLARRLMQAHDGSLTLETAAGVGTRVMLMLPAWRVEGPDRMRAPT